MIDDVPLLSHASSYEVVIAYGKPAVDSILSVSAAVSLFLQLVEKKQKRMPVPGMEDYIVTSVRIAGDDMTGEIIVVLERGVDR